MPHVLVGALPVHATEAHLSVSPVAQVAVVFGIVVPQATVEADGQAGAALHRAARAVQTLSHPPAIHAFPPVQVPQPVADRNC